MEDSIYKNVIPGFRFMLIVNGYDEIPLKSIRPFSRELEYDYIQEGGINDYVHILRKPASKPFTIQVERYAIPKTEDPISEGTVYQVPMQLVVGENHGRKFERKRTYILMWPRILNKEIGALDAERSGLLTETVTIAYSHLVLIHADTEDKGYRFEKGKIAPAYGLGAYLDVPANKESRDDFEKKAEDEEPWGWDSEGGWRGEGKRKAATNRTEARKGVMKRNAKTFEFGQGDAGDDKNDFSARAKTFRFGSGDLAEKRPFSEAAERNLWRWGDEENRFEGSGRRNARINQDEERLASRKEAALKRAWKYDKDSSPQNGGGNTNARHLPDEDDAATMKETAEALAWKYDEKDKTNRVGQGARHAKQIEEEARRETMEEEAGKNRWDYDTNPFNPEGKGKQNARHISDQPNGSGMIAKAKTFTFGEGATENAKEAFAARAKEYTFGAGKEGSAKETMTAKAQKYEFGTKVPKERAAMIAKAKTFVYGKGATEDAKAIFTAKARTFKYGNGKSNGDKKEFESKARKGIGKDEKNDRAKKIDNKSKKQFESKAKLYKYGSGGDKKDQPTFESRARLWPKQSSARTVEDFLKS